jgi:hypothetical protein
LADYLSGFEDANGAGISGDANDCDGGKQDERNFPTTRLWGPLSIPQPPHCVIGPHLTPQKMPPGSAGILACWVFGNYRLTMPAGKDACAPREIHSQQSQPFVARAFLCF